MSTLFEDVKVIYSFSDGKTVVAYKPDGKEAVIGGADGAGLHIYETESINEEYQHVEISEHVEDVTCVATNQHGAFASGGTDGIVNLYTKDNKFDRILVRSTTPVRDISFHPDGTKLAIAADDPVIRIVLCADNSKIVNLEGHKHLVKSVNYDPFGSYIISSDVHGSIHIWNVSPQEPAPRCVKVLQEYSYASDMDSVLQATVAWHPANSSSFAFPGTNNDVRVFKADIWTPEYTLDGQHTSSVITLAWSPNGYYIVSSAEDNTLVIWNTKTKTPVRVEITPTAITGIAWHPTDNEISLTDMDGNLRIWKEPIPTDNSNYPHPAKMRKRPTSAGVPASQRVFDTDKIMQPSSLPPLSSSLFADEEALDDGDELGDDVDMMDELGEGLDEEEEELGENDMGDFVIDDDGAGYVETAEQASEQKKQSRLNKGSSAMANAVLVQRQRKLEAAFDPPTTFQPGETPYHKPEPNTTFAPKNGERRYMAYNLVGAISTIYEDGHSIINVEFHDQSEYRNFHFTDVLNFTMGAISSAGTVYAVEGREAVKKAEKVGRGENDDLFDSDDSEDDQEETTQINSTLYFRPNNSGSEKDWTHHMLPGEDVVSIAINRVSVIATTSLGYVRIFSISGVQRYIFSLENVVSVAAMTDLALLVHSAGPAFGHQQNLNFMLLNTETNEVLQKDKVQLTTDSELNWIGFSETNQAATFDSAGILRLLYHQRRPFQSRWVPVFDSKAYAAANQRTETYWPVGVLRDRLMCVVLRGANTYPFFPRPPVKDIPLQLPLLEQSTEVGQLEETVLRIQACNAHEKDEAEATNTEEDYADTFREADSDMDVALLKLINIACKTEKVSKALDMTYILHSPDSIDKAIKIAVHYRYTSLAEKMTSIKQAKFINESLPTPSTLADSLAALPSMYASTQPTLEGDLAFVKREKANDSNKRNMYDSEDEDMMDTPFSKKSRPFSFSTQR
ncbi:GS catalytic domain-containing protein [Mucor velutinosus]|uniref:GS catalytic domain-containing protein n=1 Tax=Mucor velutinosus TaxID=708070 RepID=A0AAN7D1Z3_9FUNG|nr:GS catalytic domain-containing protein [Mucor velutinosus]